MHTRLIKPGFFFNESLGRMPAMARLLFVGLWLLADREGRLEDRPDRIKAEVFPYDGRANVDQMLDALAGAQHIDRYEVAGRRYIWVINFLKYQRPHNHEPASAIPPSPQEGDATSQDMTRLDATCQPRTRNKEQDHRTRNKDTDQGQVDQDLKAVVGAFEEATGRAIGITEADNLMDLVGDHGLADVQEAIQVAKGVGKLSVPYVRGILRSWATQGKPKGKGKNAKARPTDGTVQFAIDNWELFGYASRADAEAAHRAAGVG